MELRGRKASTSGEIGVGSLVKLPTADLVGIVTVCRGQAVEVKWPDDKIRLHQRRFPTTCALKLYIIGLQNCLIANASGWSFYIHYIPRIEQVY